MGRRDGTWSWSVTSWLQLGSEYQWKLNQSWMEYTYSENTFFPFVLSGEKIDNNFYDFLNSYLVERGSDGVIRLSGANLNYTMIKLVQDCNDIPFDALINDSSVKAYPLKLEGGLIIHQTAFEVIPKASHTGDKYGIMASVKKRRTVKQIIPSIIEALKVDSEVSYEECIQNMKDRSEQVQISNNKYFMFVFNIKTTMGTLYMTLICCC